MNTRLRLFIDLDSKTSSVEEIYDIRDINKPIIEQHKVQKESVRRRYANTIDL